MAKIIIIDDNRATGAFLKIALEQEDFQVTLVAQERDAIVRYKVCNACLVMINQTCRQCGGWTIFNDIKRIDGEMPLMLYFLTNFRLADIAWIIRAVKEALSCQGKAQPGEAFVLPAKKIVQTGSAAPISTKQ